MWISSSASFCRGCGSGGRLGLGDGNNKLVPTLLKGELQGRAVIQIAAGPGHSVGVTRDGLVFTWGSGSNGQLGLGPVSESMVPALVSGVLEGQAVAQADTGDRHTVCVTKEGAAYAWGAGDSGQLGTEDTADLRIPHLIAGELQQKQVTCIVAGSSHTVCRTSGDTHLFPTVFSWGTGRDGQLGLTTSAGSTDATLVPMRVKHTFGIKGGKGQKRRAAAGKGGKSTSPKGNSTKGGKGRVSPQKVSPEPKVKGKRSNAKGKGKRSNAGAVKGTEEATAAKVRELEVNMKAAVAAEDFRKAAEIKKEISALQVAAAAAGAHKKGGKAQVRGKVDVKGGQIKRVQKSKKEMDFDAMDANGDGQVGKEEFIAAQARERAQERAAEARTKKLAAKRN